MDIPKQTIVGLKDLRENLETYLSAINRGTTFTVVRRSKPIFNITPVDAEESIWEIVIDFSKIKKGGVNIPKLISRL